MTLSLDSLRGLLVPSAQDLQRPLRPYNPDGLIAALDALEKDGDAGEQRKTLEHLKVALDRNRPGERSIFGQGINPVPPAEETP